MFSSDIGDLSEKIAMADLKPEPEPEPVQTKNGDSFDSSRKVVESSGVMATREEGVLGRRKWDCIAFDRVAVVLGMHILGLFAPFYFDWTALRVAGALACITGLGITLSYHRNLTHRSFRLPKLLEYSFAYCGALALQGDPIDWASTHRYHHQFVDSDRDPHSPLKGFWYSHMNWIFDRTGKRSGRLNNVMDLKKQPFYRFLRSTYILHPIALGLLLHKLGGFPFLVWGMGVRTVVVFHITFMVNSVCHVWGKQSWNTGDLSRNNWLVGLLALGEGWHNNHHAFRDSARQGLEWWQIDVTWYLVKLLEAAGLATDVKLPTEIQMQKLAFNSVTKVD